MISSEEKVILLKKITKLYDLYHTGAIKTLLEHEVHPNLPKGSRENYLYFTLPPCLNFQRSSPAMWASALRTYEDPDTNYLFYPEQLILFPREKIQADLTKHGLALQKNKHTDIWMTISKTFKDHYDSDPRNLLAVCDWDVTKILAAIQVEKRKLFPYLSGPKMANYWLFILSKFTDAKFRNMHEISIIPDTHVLQCSVQLGLTVKFATPIQVAAAWKEVLQGSVITPVEMHPVLWNWSRNNFQPEV